MDEVKLQAFVCVADLKSINKAAQKLFTQPSVILRQINSLEEELDCKLLFRSSTGCSLTPSGMILYERAAHILQEFDEIRAELINDNHSEIMIRICSPDHSSLPLIESYCSAFAAEHQEIILQYYAAPTNEWLEAIRNEKADCALVIHHSSESMKINDLRCHGVITRPMVCLLHSKHPLAKKQLITCSDLRNEHIFSDAGSIEHIIQSCNEYDLRIQSIAIDPHVSDIQNLCRNMNCCITSTPWDSLFPGLVSVPFDIPPLECVWVTRKKVSSALLAFIHSSIRINNQI